MRMLTTLMLTLALAVPALPAGAAFEGPGAQRPAATHNTITQASQVAGAAKDTRCVLEGNILERVKKDTYVFQDASGKVVVEIDRKAFGPETVTPETKVRLHGEVDTDRDRPNEVDVRHLEIIK